MAIKTDKNGRRLPAKFVEHIDHTGSRFKGKRTEEQKKAQSEKMKAYAARKKTFKEIAKALLDMKPAPELVQQILEVNPGLDPEVIDQRLAMLQSMIIRALKGDPKAFEVVRDTAGEKPVEKQQVSAVVSETQSLSAEEIKENVKNLRQFFDNE